MLLRDGDLVLFQGDSITNAFRMPDEVNNAYQLGAGYAMIAAAQLLRDHPAAGWRFANRGVSGQSVPDLLARWKADCLDLAPDVLSLLVGINDCVGHLQGERDRDPASFERGCRELLARLRAAKPSARFVLGEPFALECGIIGRAHRQALAGRQATVRAIAAEFGAVFVPYQAAFDDACRRAPPEYWIYDGIHPTAPGFSLMARLWIERVAAA
jgi:lysophospholipase L1-like esterase